MAAPHRTAASLRDIAGTNRPDRQATGAPPPGEVLAIMPKRPDWLTDHWAIDEWQRLGPVLLNAGLLTVGNINAFAQLCASHGRLAEAYQNGERVNASDIAQFRGLICEFGLTPASAAKVRAPDPAQGRGNPFAGNGKPANR